MKLHHSSLTALIAVLSVFAACTSAIVETPTIARPQFSYTVSECDQDIPVDQLTAWARVDITAREGTVQIRQNLDYVCCAEIVLAMKQEENVIKIIETNKGDICKCMCGYKVSAEITGLPAGRYTIQVWGVEYQDVHAPELLGEKEIDL